MSCLSFMPKGKQLHNILTIRECNLWHGLAFSPTLYGSGETVSFGWHKNPQTLSSGLAFNWGLMADLYTLTASCAHPLYDIVVFI